MSTESTKIHDETDNVVFYEQHTLNYGTDGSDIDKLLGEGKVNTSRKYWYNYSHRHDGSPAGKTRLTDRWIYLFAKSSANGGGGAKWRLLHEYYVDSSGVYWRSDESALFYGSWIDQHYRSAADREEAMAAKRGKAGKKGGPSGNPYTRIPYLANGQKCSVVSFAMAYPMPAVTIPAFLELASRDYLPWAVQWHADEARPVVYYSGKVEAGGAPAHAITTVDPLELAVRTNRAFSSSLDKFNKVYRGQTDKELYARELHLFLSQNHQAFSKVRDELAVASTDPIWSEFSRTEYELRQHAIRYEWLAGVLAAFIRSPLWRATADAYRWDDKDAVFPPPDPKKPDPEPRVIIVRENDTVVYYLFKLKAALERLGLSHAGDALLTDMARRQAGFADDATLNDYILPSGPVPKTVVKNVKTGSSAILGIYSFLLSRMNQRDKLDLIPRLTETHFGRLLKAMGVKAEFASVESKDLFFGTHRVHFKGRVEVFVIEHSDYRRIQDAVEEETRDAIKGRFLHADLKQVLADVGMALDLISLAVTAAEFQEKHEAGLLTWQEGINRGIAWANFAKSAAARYVVYRYGEKAAEAALRRLAIAGGLVAIVSGAVNLYDSSQSYMKGDYGKAVGSGLAGAMGMLGGIVAITMTSPPGWLVLGILVLGVAGGMVVAAFTLDELEQFAKFCEWGKGADNEAQLAQKPKFSAHTFGEWKGNYAIQRDALTRILCAFELKAQSDGGVKITLGQVGPRGVVHIWWKSEYRTTDSSAPIEPTETETREFTIPASAFADGTYVDTPPKEWADRNHEVLTATVWLDAVGDLPKGMDRRYIPANAKGCRLVTLKAVYTQSIFSGNVRTVTPTGARIRSLDVQEEIA